MNNEPIDRPTVGMEGEASGELAAGAVGVIVSAGRDLGYPFFYQLSMDVRTALPTMGRRLFGPNYGRFLNSMDRVSGRLEHTLGLSQRFTPPMSLRLGVGFFNSLNPRRWHALGKKHLGAILELTGLKRTGRVLDIGCGCGRLAGEFTGYLNVEGRYEGIDTQSALINWDQRFITASYPNFVFRTTKTANPFYSPEGKLLASEYRFPYDDDSFDLVIAISLFTHLLPRDGIHYLRETRRVLRPGGKLFATWLFFTRVPKAPVFIGPKENPPTGRLRITYGTTRPEVPEEVLAYTPDSVNEMYRVAGLPWAIEPIRRVKPTDAARLRRWSVRQDIVVAEKTQVAGAQCLPDVI